MATPTALTPEEQLDIVTFNLWASGIGKEHLQRIFESPLLSMYGATIVEQRKAILAESSFRRWLRRMRETHAIRIENLDEGVRKKRRRRA